MTDTLTRLQPIANSIIHTYFHTGGSFLSVAESIFLHVWSFGGMVDNGGLAGFYYNSTGEHASVTVRALRAVGAIESARILEEANRLFGDAGPPIDLEERNNALMNLSPDQSERLELLDAEYFQLAEDQLALLARYVDNNQGAFITIAN